MPANEPTQGSASSMLATRVPNSPPTPLTKTRRPAAMTLHVTQTRRQLIGQLVGTSLGVVGAGLVAAGGLARALPAPAAVVVGATANERADRMAVERKLHFPVDISAGRLVIPNRFGGYSNVKGSGGHNGIDIGRGADCGDPTSFGQPLLACADGVFVDTSVGYSSYGLKITLRDALGNHFHYHHMESIVEGLELGDEVRRGQVVGFMGRSGNTSWAHLHFEVWVGGLSRQRGGMAVDPEPWLPLPIAGVTVGSGTCDI